MAKGIGKEKKKRGGIREKSGQKRGTQRPQGKSAGRKGSMQKACVKDSQGGRGLLLTGEKNRITVRKKGGEEGRKKEKKKGGNSRERDREREKGGPAGARIKKKKH